LLLGWCKSVSAAGLDGVTISGGEPFEQPEALLCILQGLADWRASSHYPFDILCYSGLPFSLLKKYDHILSYIDAIIPEPFIQGQTTNKLWRGSPNQPLITLTDLGNNRYSYLPANRENSSMQFVVEDEKIWFIGVPSWNDMERLRKKLIERGIKLEDCSWIS